MTQECPEAESAVSEVGLRIALGVAEEQRALANAVIESVGDAVLAIDNNRIFLIANQAARRVFAEAEAGKPLPDDWAGLHRSRRLDGTPLTSSEGALVRALRGERTDGLTFTLQAPGASEPVWVEASGRPVLDAAGNVIAAVAVYRDVSEKLRQVDVYRTLVRSIPQAAVGLFDRELRCLAIDGGLARSDGAAPADMLGRTMRELAGLGADDPRFDPIDALYRGVFEGREGSTDYVDAERGRVLDLHVAPVCDAAGRINAGIVLALDRTQERRNEADLRHSEQINRALVRHLPNGAVFMVDRDLRVVAADGPILEEVLRRGNWDTLVGRTVSEVVAPANRAEILEIYRSAFDGHTERREIRRQDRFMEVNAVPVIAPGGSISHVIAFLYDVTERKLEAEELRQTRDLLARERSLLSATLEHMSDGVVLLDAERRIVLANAAYADMLALPRERHEGMTRAPFMAHLATLLADPAEALERLALYREGPEDFVFARPRRRILRRLETRVQLPTGGAYLVTWRDVTAEADLLAERERQLTIDGLTGIANRTAAEAALRLEDARRRRSGARFSVAIFDIDHFKQVNDRYGHATGDEVLRFVAEALNGQARITDLVARWGGEEFLAVLPGPLSGAVAFAERAREAVERTPSSKVERITVSVGVAEIGLEEALEAVLQRADEHLYDAKRRGRNRVVA